MKKPEQISKSHPNRKAHNWLAYDICDRFLESCAEQIQGTVIDLGAGDAPYEAFFQRHAIEYLPVDWQLNRAGRHAGVIADLNRQLPIADGAADCVVALQLLEHLRTPDRIVSEAFRLLRPSGHFLVTVPWQWRVHEAPHDYFRYTPFALRMLLEDAGFSDIQIHPSNGLFSTLALKINYFLLRFFPGPRWLQLPVKLALHALWYSSQKVAPLLDRADREWTLETAWYFVAAKKP